MQTLKINYKRHRFPPQIIAHVVWLYVRFNLSLREVEELMLERGVDVSYETIRRWTVKFGPLIARVLRRRQPRPGDVWHLVMVRMPHCSEQPNMRGNRLLPTTDGHSTILLVMKTQTALKTTM